MGDGAICVGCVLEILFAVFGDWLCRTGNLGKFLMKLVKSKPVSLLDCLKSAAVWTAVMYVALKEFEHSAAEQPDRNDTGRAYLQIRDSHLVWVGHETPMDTYE